MAKTKEPNTCYTVEEVYGTLTSSSSDEDVDSSNPKENILEGLSKELFLAVHKEYLRGTPSGLSNSLSVSREYHHSRS